ncbi:MAG: hypothetical protein L0211_18310 [Planctomycetaceae bacterium]|nr:hypothetical protein [Planctomycetaceae bacterium]
MNRVFVLIVGAALIVGCGKPASKAKGSKLPPPPPGSGVKISEAGISIDGKQLTLPATTAQLTDVLGQPNRTLDKANKIFVWDQRGIYAYCRKNKDEIHDISFAFQKQDFDFDPQTLFSGTIDVAGTSVSAGTKENELKAAGFAFDLSTFEKAVGERSVLVEYDGRALGLSYSLP